MKYEKITYPNCQGTPITINTEDGVFRLPEYVINSAPKTGEAPYSISYVKALPSFHDSSSVNTASVMALSDNEGDSATALMSGEAETGLTESESTTELETK